MEQNPGSTGVQRRPRVLLAEDDPASARFLSASLETLGCRVLSHATGSAALQAATDTRFDLLVIDCQLPDREGLSLIASLRSDSTAASRHAPAVATSAEWNNHKQRAMLGGGFAALIGKPCSLDELRHLLEAHVDPAALPMRQEGSARVAAGSAANLAALRRLFARELGTLAGDLPALCADPPRLTDHLHRLCASAGFCGAPALAAASRQWLQRLRSGEDHTAERVQFERALSSATETFTENS